MARTLPPKDPGQRRALLLGFHATLCLRSGPGPERHRLPGGSENRLEARCWTALATVDHVVGNLDELVDHLHERTDEIKRETARREAARSNLEQSLGLIPPAIDGEIATTTREITGGTA